MTLDYPKDIPEVYCVYSSGLLTIKRLVYKPPSLFRLEFPNQSPKLEYEDGDGTVNMQSLQYCNKWPNASVIHLAISNHVPILADKRFLQFVQNHVTTSKQQVHIYQSVSRLQHDPYTYESHDSNECDVTFPGWGDTWSVEYLSQHISFEYFGSLVSELMKDKFYVRNFTMRGAPYDFRKSPDDNKQFVVKFKSLVEETYTNGLDRPVVLLGHSLGSLYTLYFLKNQTKHWKQKYIKSFLSVSAPLGGTVN
ncbi:unnamed protein product, partial [Schistosoma mattheei]